MTILRTKRAPERVRVFRQYVFSGRTPRGEHVEIVTRNVKEITTRCAIQELTGVLTYHNVKVWPKGAFKNGAFIQ